MQYENPEVKDGVNTTDIHPLLDFSWLLAGVALLIGGFMGTVYILAGWLLPYIPPGFEKELVSRYDIQMFIEPATNDEEFIIQQYLQQLSDQLVESQNLPQDLKITVHYNSSDQKNAFATLGGHIIINKGILETIDSENGLAMVLAHEIGHVINRDPIMSMGRGVVSLTALALITGFSHSTVSDTILNVSTETMLTGFNRNQERHADEYGLALLDNYYGHHQGADEFFKYIQRQDKSFIDDSSLSEFFSTHPNIQERIDLLGSFTLTTGELTELPAYLR